MGVRADARVLGKLARRAGLPDVADWLMGDEARSVVQGPERGPHVHRTLPDWVYVDSGFLHAAGAHAELSHMGFGDFRARTPHGDVLIIRTGGDNVMPEQDGRAHSLSGEREAIEYLVGAVMGGPRGNPRARAIVWTRLRGNPDEDDTEREAEADRALLRRMGMVDVGLNADWNVSAYQITRGRANETPGAAYLLDLEDGTWSVVRRWYVADDYAGIPEEYRSTADGHNDAIATFATFQDLDAFARWEASGGMQTLLSPAGLYGLGHFPTTRPNPHARLHLRVDAVVLQRLAALARKAGMAALGSSLDIAARDTEHVRDLAPPRGAEEPEAAAGEVHLQGEAPRRHAALAALRILRSYQARRVAGGSMPTLLPGDARALRDYSGWGGIDVRKIPLEQRGLLEPDQQEYLRIADARDEVSGRIAREEGRAAKAAELPDFGAVRGAFAGLIAQYFTPVEVAAGMIEWGVRVFESVNGGVRPRSIVEPSAGIGRFIRAYDLAGYGGEPSWDAVELDTDLADMMRLLYTNHPGPTARWGTVQVHNMAFEQFYAGNPRQQADMVVGNPPYAKRGSLKSVDPLGARWDQAAHYFLWRSLQMLAPRGTMVQLVPAGLLTGPDGASTQIREELLRDGHLAAAVMPPFEIFPGALLNLCISVWVKRPHRLPGVLEADRFILEGRYFEAPEYRGGIMGKPQGGNYRPEAITGAWDIERLRAQPIRVPPPELFEAAPAAAAASGGAAPRRVQAFEDGDDLVAAEALGSRVMRFRQAIESSPSLARAGQAELQADLRDFAHALGVHPHTIKPPPGAKPSASVVAFWSAYEPDRVIKLTPVLSNLIAAPVGTYSGARTLRAAALHLAAARGSVTADEVGRTLGTTVSPIELALTDDVYFEPHSTMHGQLAYLRAEEFFTGEAYPRYDWCRAIAEGTEAFPLRATPSELAALREKCAASAKRLITLIGPLSLGEIDLGVRSHIVHDRTPGSNDYDAPVMRGYIRDRLGVELDSVAVMSGWMVAEGVNAHHPKVEELIAYFNRQDKYADARGKQKARQKDEGSLEDRLAADRKLDEGYADYCRSHADAPRIEEAYNRAFRGYIARVYSNAPLELARANEAASSRVRPHAWAAVRRGAERRGGINALDVGLGKTASSLFMIALLRQLGRVRRPMFVVPNSVGPNWLEEIAMWLADFRIVPIGFTVRVDKAGLVHTSPDSAQKTLSKLQGLAAGRFDGAVVQHSTFERIRVDPHAAAALFQNQFGVQREISLAKKADEAAVQRLVALEAELTTASGKRHQIVRDQVDKLKVTPWLARLRDQAQNARRAGNKKDVNRIEKQIEAFAKKQSPTDRARQTDQQRFEQWVGERAAAHRQPIDGITWEELGIDALVVDEAHEFKNLYGPASRYGKRAKYMGAMSATKVVRKCWDLWIKAGLLRSHREDTGVFLLTATPLKNSPLEAFNLLSYCTRAAFEARGLLTPEDYIDRYCRPESEPVLTVRGGFREDLAVRTFTNLHELRGIFVTFVDVKVALPPDEYEAAIAEGRNMANVVQLPLPKAHYQTIFVPMDADQEAVYEPYRKEAAAAAEQAAAKLCERAVRQIDGPPGDIPRLVLPDPAGMPYARQVRTLRALTTQHNEVVTAASKADRILQPPKGQAGDWDGMQAGEKRADTIAWVAELYASLRAFLTEHEARGTLDLEDATLGSYGAVGGAGKHVSEAASPGEDEDEDSIADVDVDVGGSGGDDDVDEDAEKGEKEDLFTVMDRMSKAALDLRLLQIDVGRHPPKYRALAEQVAKLKGCGHVVFCDYNVTHQWIMDALHELAGVPRERMISVTGATMTPGERQEVARRLNGVWDAKKQVWIRAPDIDVVIGGKSIEQGMNLQERSCALHHLTFPWEPATVQQRNGRAMRQGNRLSDVWAFYYASERSFDGYRLSLITGKRGWMRDLLESADRATNNPGAELSGPCAMLMQLSSDEALAKEYCKCLDNASAKKALALRRERAAEDFAALVANVVSAGRDGPQQAYYAEQADRLRTRLRAMDEEVFPRKDLIEIADRVPLFWDHRSGTPWIQGTAMCMANTPMWIERINTKKSEIVIRQQGRWFATTWTFGDAGERGKDASATCDWNHEADAEQLAHSHELRAASLRMVSPELFEARRAAALSAMDNSFSSAPWLDGEGRLRIEVPGRAQPSWRLLLPWGREDADAFLEAVKELGRYARIEKRSLYSSLYTAYFGRVYPADLRDEK